MKYLVALLLLLALSASCEAQWRILNSPLKVNYQSIYFRSADEGIIVGDSVAFYTVNGGETWARFPISDTDGCVLRDLYFSPQSSLIVIVGHDYGYNVIKKNYGGRGLLLKSTDVGQTWIPFYDTITSRSFSSLSAVND